MYRVVLIGLPTAGKSTLSYLAARALSVPQLNLGQRLRNAVCCDHELHEFVSRGHRCDDQLAINVVRAEIEYLSNSGYFLDGFPRNLTQLQWFEQLSAAASCRFILLDLDESSVRSRYLRRMSCSECRRADYGEARTADPVCQRCGGPLLRRADTTPEALEQKLMHFRREETPMLQFLQEQCRLLRLAITGDTECDLEALLQVLTGYK
jgi:adenylate kinase